MRITDKIFERLRLGKAPEKDEILHLLGLPEDSAEALELRGLADSLMRKRFGNKVMILGQIGIENKPCPANCKFCAFAEDVNRTDDFLSDGEILAKAGEMCSSGGIYSLFLMAMHNFDRERLLRAASLVRKGIPDSVNLVVNIGDCDEAYLRELKRIGVGGAYHVCRLREGVDTQLNPDDRIAMIESIKAVGLDWYTCCEPIGSEHTDDEIAEQMMIANRYGCFQNAAMARVNFAGSPLEGFAEISRARLAQIVAIAALSSLENAGLRSVAVHEPDTLSLLSGANSLYAESGKNPRDTAPDTACGRGRSVEDVVEMFRRANFDV